jgi:hypothetical protein
MFIQGDEINEWLPALAWQTKLMNTSPNYYFTNIKTDGLHRIHCDRGQTIIKHNNFTYVLYYKYGNYQGYDIPIILNLNTGTSRLIYASKDKKHYGARIDKTLAKIFNELILGRTVKFL